MSSTNLDNLMKRLSNINIKSYNNTKKAAAENAAATKNTGNI